MPSLTSPSFRVLVEALKRRGRTVTTIESCCGGLVGASILAQPGASAVFYGGSVSYNTRRAKPFLLNDDNLYKSLVRPLQADSSDGGGAESERDAYVRSKLDWTRRTAEAFCRETGTDYCLAEAGATGPTFRPAGLETGFAVVAVAARDSASGRVEVVRQEVVNSDHADRQANMRLFADAAANLLLEVLGEEGETGAEHPGPSKQRQLQQQHVLDRATHLRSDEGALADLARNSKHLVLHRNKILFCDTSDPGTRELAFLTGEEIDRLSSETGMTRRSSFLGLLDGRDAVFGADMICDTPPDEDGGVSTSSFERAAERIAEECNGPSRFENTRTVAPLLLPGRPVQNELALHATALAEWQRRAQFCMSCGSDTVLLEGGTCRQCTSCEQRTWPRQDPSMIAVVSSRDGRKVLLARSKRHPSSMYTALAGFVEAGESMERAVAREVFEETGVRIDENSVRYVASQPWPFPQSTMVGFTATADSRQKLNIDTDELVDARWFDRSQVLAATSVEGPVMQHDAAKAAIEANPRLDLLVPPRGVLARRLIDVWLDAL